VVAVINYKGGVGKTTITANIGTELAARGHRVLLIDCDPQASLTFSFYRPEEWKSDLADGRTIREWFSSFLNGSGSVRLGDPITTPPRVNLALANSDGRVDLIASHLLLINVDLALAGSIGGAGPTESSVRYVRTMRRLADGLRETAFRNYDYVLIDCRPNFNLVTKSAMIASGHVLIPARPDYLSTLGIKYLKEQLYDLRDEYNRSLSIGGVGGPQDRVSPRLLGVVLNMLQNYRDKPIKELAHDLAVLVNEGDPDLYIFAARLRENKTRYSRAAREGVPAVLNARAHAAYVRELIDVTSEFLRRIESGEQTNA
jgi:chromosome partitioning protein